MKVYATFLYGKPSFATTQFEKALELDIPNEKLDYWLKFDLDEFIEEYEPIPQVEEDPLTEEWDRKYEANVKITAEKIGENNLCQAICNYLNHEGDLDSFYIETIEKLKNF